uniref:Uncharacterized protein n=1 Tax=Aegilops tauschii TaxID=37682 RepID=M8BWY6_AEGTA
MGPSMSAPSALRVFLPLVECAFRASLEGGRPDGDELRLCIQTCDAGRHATSSPLSRRCFRSVYGDGVASSAPFMSLRYCKASSSRLSNQKVHHWTDVPERVVPLEIIISDHLLLDGSHYQNVCIQQQQQQQSL